MDITILFQNYLFDQKVRPSGNTVRNYLADINLFIRWLKASYGLSFQPGAVTFYHIENFVRYLEGQNLSPATIERRLSSLRKFFEFLLSIHLISQSPLVDLKAQTAGRADPHHLGEFKNFLYRQGLAANTIKNYLFDLEHFFSWLSQAAYQLDFSVNNISEYKNRLLNILKLSPLSINRKLSALRLYAKFAKEQGYLKNNPFDSEEITQEVSDTPKTTPQIYQEPRFNRGWFDKLPFVRLFDYLLVRPIDTVINKVNGIDIAQLGRYVRNKNSLSNVKKDFYSPYKKTVFIPYLIPLALLIITAGLLFGLEQIGLIGPISPIGRQEKTAVKQITEPAGFTFSGKLTDRNGSAVNKTSLVIFSFYEDPDKFTNLIYQTSKEVTPDEQGFFKVILASLPPSISQSLIPVYLGIAIQGDAEMRPRQLVGGSSVSYPTGRLLFDSEGKLTIANDSPNIIASSGTFTLTGQSIALRTAQNSNSSILLWPDGDGKVDVLSPLANSITGTVEIADSLSINSQSENDAFLVQIGGKSAFAIDNSGNTITNGALSVSGVASVTSLSVAGDTSILGSFSNLNTGGLYAIWYDDTGTPGNFKGRPFKQTVLPQVNFSQVSPAPSIKEHSLQIIGYIRPPYSESYTFYLTTTDGIRVFINQNKILDNWQSQGKITHQASLYLDANRWYPVIIEHFQDDTSDELIFEWSSNSQARQVVPSASLAYSLSDVGPRRLSNLHIERDLTVGKNLNVAQNMTVSGTLTVQTAETTLQLSATQASQRLCGTQSNGTAGAAIIRDCGDTQTDLAEYYGSDGTLTAGDLVVINKEKPPVAVDDPLNIGKTSSKAWIQKSAGIPYQKEVIGIVSTNPSSESLGRDLFSVEEHPVPVGLAGRVPVKVSTENGPIETGDYLTSSSIPGVAMKATRAGQVVGKALESLKCDVGSENPDILNSRNQDNQNQENPTSNVKTFCQSKILALITLSFYNPDLLFTADGQLIAKEATYSGLANTTNTTNTTNNSINPIEFFVGSLKAMLLDVQQLFAQTANIGQVKTDIISPLSSDTIIVDGQLTVKGDATISGELRAESLEVSNDATVSGTLRAKKIIAEEIEGLEARIANLTSISASQHISESENQITSRSADQTDLADSLTNRPAGLLTSASSSAALRIDKFFAESGSFFDGLISLGPTGLSDTSITGILSLGSSFILHDNSINVLGADLKLQSLGQGGLSIADGRVYIDNSGNLKVKGDAVFAGTLSANIISPIPNQDLIIHLGGVHPATSEVLRSDSSDGERFIIQNASGSAVLRITDRGDLTASGSARFADIEARRAEFLKLKLPPLVASASADINSQIGLGSVGKAAILGGTTEATIKTTSVTENSLIYLTPTSDTKGLTLYVARQIPDESFTVAIADWINKDITFNWWVIN
ncbi:site-specific integrase [Candidatus Microgenomates bacterium]|nr:site-specific integrase [Candidatus Microgenomates bacterium]